VPCIAIDGRHGITLINIGFIRRIQDMSNFTKVRAMLGAVGMLALLSACGGGDGDTPAETTTAGATSSFISAYTTGLTTLNSFGGLNSASLGDLFDTAFLDSGSTKADVVAALQSEAQAAAVSPDFPSIAQMTVSNISISNCDAATKICTLSGTLTNNDADTTSVPFTTQVKQSDKLRLYGDQSQS
jgi:hypothetical protein